MHACGGLEAAVSCQESRLLVWLWFGVPPVEQTTFCQQARQTSPITSSSFLRANVTQFEILESAACVWHATPNAFAFFLLFFPFRTGCTFTQFEWSTVCVCSPSKAAPKVVCEGQHVDRAFVCCSKCCGSLSLQSALAGRYNPFRREKVLPIGARC